jgi:hypothetical protein
MLPYCSPFIKPILQVSCAGELGITLINGNLQAGFHMPAAQSMAAFFTNWLRQVMVTKQHLLVPQSI